MHIKSILWVVCLTLFHFLVCCSGAGAKSTNQTDGNVTRVVEVPIFNADSAYAFVASQVAFGPRVPNSEAHRACGDYLVEQLKTFGAHVVEQCDVVDAFDGTPLQMRNIIGSYQLENR